MAIKTKMVNLYETFIPARNTTRAAENTGLRRIFYGDRHSFGLHHVFTAGRFRKEIIQYHNISGALSESALATKKGIEASIPTQFKDAFLDLRLGLDYGHLPNALHVNSPLVCGLAENLSKLRRGYDMLIDKPIAKMRSKLYFGCQGVKEALGIGLKPPKIDAEYVRRFMPHFVKLPENLNDENAKEIFIEILRASKYSEKDIKNVLKGKAPRLYRFVDETELRAVQNGQAMSSSASYHVDWYRTDVTSDPKYNFNKYRITFKKKAEFNPYDNESRVNAHDLLLGKWFLNGDYTREDIVCTERIF